MQYTLEGDDVIDVQIKKSLDIIRTAANKSGLTPLIVNFSGGNDSLLLLDLVQTVTDNFLCCYMVSGIDFPAAKTFAKRVCTDFGRPLLFSYPEDHKGDFFKRLAKFKKFPTIKATWCARDLKIRPQHKMLRRRLHYQRFFKLNGVRRFESGRRQRIHVSTPRKQYMLPDDEVSKDIMVFPILDWKNEEVKAYLKREKLRIRENPLYKKYGVSGCYYCPFYQRSIYECVMKLNPTIYDSFIEWELKLHSPSIINHQWLFNLKFPSKTQQVFKEKD